MKAEIEAFQAEVRGRRGARRKGAAPYEAEMIARGRELATRLQAAGEPGVSVARRLGIARKTLMKWLGETARRPSKTRASRAGFVRVGLKSAGRAEAVAGTAGVRLVSPRGYRIEGIDIVTAVAILREVG
jgi:hypothetical protein